MSTIRKLAPLALAGIVAVGYFLFQQTDNPPVTEDTAEAPQKEAVKDPVAVVKEAPATEEPSPFEVVESEPEAAEQTDIAQDEVEEQTDVPQTDVAQSDAQPSAEPVVTTTTNPVKATAVVVPSSYSIEDADKYFIPKEERGPGNIGGPPPLNFPGGPNDKSLPGSGEG